jgi:hypothetical protein
VGEVEHAALAELHVERKVVLQPLPQLQRMLVDRGGLVPQIVRPDDGGVPRHVPPGQPSLLDDAHVGDAVAAGEVVGGREAMASAADDDHLIRAFGLGGPPVSRALGAHTGRVARAD